MGCVDMADNDLLKKEEEFRKLNAELEEQTRQLMKDVEAVIEQQQAGCLAQAIEELLPEDGSRVDLVSPLSQRSDSGLEEMYQPRKSTPTHKFSGGGSFRRSTSTRPLPRDDVKLLSKKLGGLTRSGSHAGLCGDSNDDVVPAAARGLSSEGLIRFLKAKVKMLQSEYQTLQQDFTKRTDEWRQAQNVAKQSDEVRTKAVHDLVLAKDKVKKQETEISTLNDKLQLADSEATLLRKEIEMLKVEVKRLQTSSSGSDARYNKAKEEVEKLKQNLKLSQTNEKEARDKLRIRNEELTANIRKLEKQKAELITGFKKQICLIDNLKRQKTLYDVNSALRYSEEEYLKLLDWTPE